MEVHRLKLEEFYNKKYQKLNCIYFKHFSETELCLKPFVFSFRQLKILFKKISEIILP